MISILKGLLFLLFPLSLFSQNYILKNTGTLKGWNSAIYKVNINNGDFLKVKLEASNRFVFFNINAPKEKSSIFIGSSVINPDNFEGHIFDEGEYEVVVYFMRNEARRNKIATYNLFITLRSEEKMQD